eukprot:5539547-Pleurochrysis_carterae.AAC.1
MRVGEPNRRIAPTVIIKSRRKSDEHRALGLREHATRPAAPRVFVTSVCRPEPPGNKDKLARGTSRRRREAQTLGVRADWRLPWATDTRRPLLPASAPAPLPSR